MAFTNSDTKQSTIEKLREEMKTQVTDHSIDEVTLDERCDYLLGIMYKNDCYTFADKVYKQAEQANVSTNTLLRMIAIRCTTEQNKIH